MTMQKMQQWRKLLDEIPDEEEEPQPENDEEAYNAAYIRGSRMHEQNDIDGAIYHWSEALRMDPSDGRVWWNRGAVRRSQGDLDGAISDLSEAVARSPDLADAWFARGSAKSDMGDEAGAIADFSECIRLNPNCIEAWCCRGICKLGTGDYKGAAADGDGAVKVDETASGALGLRGAAKNKLGDHAGAVSDCREALKIDPDVPWIRSTLEVAQQSMLEASFTNTKREGDGDDECWQQMLGGYRDFEREEDGDAEGNGYEEDEDEAAIRKVLAEKKTPVNREKGNVCFKQGDLQGAIAAYKLAAEAQEPDWVLAVSNQAICHLKLEELREAVECADVCIAHPDAPQKAYLTRFKALAAQRNWLEAFATLRKLRALPGVSADVEAAALQEEQLKRSERAELVTARGEGDIDVFVNVDDEESQTEFQSKRGAANFILLSQSLGRTVALAMTDYAEISKIDIVAARDEEPYPLAHLEELAEDVLIRMVGPDVKREDGASETKVVAKKNVRIKYLKGTYQDVVALEDKAEVAILCCPDFASDFEEWAAIISHLIKMKVLTVVTGYNMNHSLVQNEDILTALGCAIVLPTTRSPHGMWLSGRCKNYHVLSFRGGTPRGSALLPALKQRLVKRGFLFAESLPQPVVGPDE